MSQTENASTESKTAAERIKVDQEKIHYENIPGYTTVGKVRDAHGLKGELFIIVFAKKADWAEKLSRFVLVWREQVEGQWVPVWRSFNVDRLKPHKVGLILRTKELENRTDAEFFAGAAFQIPSDCLVSQPGERIYLKEIEGFTVTTAEGEVGPVRSFSSNGAQDLLVVERSSDQFVEIPFVKDFIKSIDYKARVINMDLPSGLIDSEKVQ
ncbi:MAG: ribosome maturation factor RimM [Bdellovibrionales bacterium]